MRTSARSLVLPSKHSPVQRLIQSPDQMAVQHSAQSHKEEQQLLTSSVCLDRAPVSSSSSVMVAEVASSFLPSSTPSSSTTSAAAVFGSTGFPSLWSSTLVACNVTICDNNLNYNNKDNNNRKVANNGMLRCLFFNARRLSKKKQPGEFELVLKSCTFNIVAVWKTWLNNSSPISLLDANGDYTVFSQDRVGRGRRYNLFIIKFENIIVHRANYYYYYYYIHLLRAIVIHHV